MSLLSLTSARWTWGVLCWGDRLTASFADVLRQHAWSFCQKRKHKSIIIKKSPETKACIFNVLICWNTNTDRGRLSSETTSRIFWMKLCLPFCQPTRNAQLRSDYWIFPRAWQESSKFGEEATLMLNFFHEYKSLLLTVSITREHFWQALGTGFVHYTVELRLHPPGEINRKLHSQLRVVACTLCEDFVA